MFMLKSAAHSPPGSIRKENATIQLFCNHCCSANGSLQAAERLESQLGKVFFEWNISQK
jgi:hypothetical protein